MKNSGFGIFSLGHYSALLFHLPLGGRILKLVGIVTLAVAVVPAKLKFYLEIIYEIMIQNFDDFSESAVSQGLK